VCRYALEYTFPEEIPELSRSLISELLTLDPNQRLGYGTGGVGRLRSHPFFQGGAVQAAFNLHRTHVTPAGTLLESEISQHNGAQRWSLRCSLPIA
jgi:hypothetical protein